MNCLLIRRFIIFLIIVKVYDGYNTITTAFVPQNYIKITITNQQQQQQQQQQRYKYYQSSLPMLSSSTCAKDSSNIFGRIITTKLSCIQNRKRLLISKIYQKHYRQSTMISFASNGESDKDGNNYINGNTITDSVSVNGKSERKQQQSQPQQSVTKKVLFDIHVDYDCDCDSGIDYDDYDIIVGAASKSTTVNGVQPVPVRKQNRCADYPPFVYDTKELNNKKNQYTSSTNNKNNINNYSWSTSTLTNNESTKIKAIGSKQDSDKSIGTTRSDIRNSNRNNKNNTKYRTVIVKGDKDEKFVYQEKTIVSKNGERQTTYKKEKVVGLQPSEPVLTNTQQVLLNVFGTSTFEPGSQNMADLINTATRLRLDRSYARKEPFEQDNISIPPSLNDLRLPKFTNRYEGFWISTPARIINFVSAYIAFPYITKIVNYFINDIDLVTLDEITSKFTPGIAILYGTFISLTLSILYNRQRTIQDNASVECSKLAFVTRNMLSLYKYDPYRAVEAGQCSADQIRTLVKSSRGAELMLLMYSDPYARMLELIDSYENEHIRYKTRQQQNNNIDKQQSTSTSSIKDETIKYYSEGLVSICRETIQDLFRIRAHRLSDEALELPPTHFVILNLLTILILLGYTISIIPTISARAVDVPAAESSIFFASLFTTYNMFYNFASDLNNPFGGVYQIRRSAAASHLLQLKWLLSNHPLTNNNRIDFNEPITNNNLNDNENDTVIQINCPGIGDMWFESNEIYVRDNESNVINS